MSPMNICFDVPQNPFPTAVALGTFDGVHLGHAQVLQSMDTAATQAGLQRWVYTFKNHPKEVVSPQKIPALLTSWQEKVTLLQDFMPLEGIVLQSFDTAFSQQSPEDFVRDVLCRQLHVKHVSVGYNFRFGHQARGNGELLKTMGKKEGFSVDIVPAYESHEQVVSSSRIRTLLQSGKLAEALPLLRGSYLVQGKVIHGQGIAAKFLGVPTANLELNQERKLLPPKGVYACQVRINGSDQRYPGILNLGLRPTFSGEGLSLEVYLLDFEGDLYGQTLQVYFQDFIRAEEKFDGPEALKTQIHKDIARARQLLQHVR